MSYLKALWARYKYYRMCSKVYLWRNMVSSVTYLKYPPNCTFNGLKVLNFGCGSTIYKASNVVNMDCEANPYVTVQPADVIKLPFENDTFDHVIANHVLEHLPRWFETVKELARVLKVGGQLEVWIPPVSSDSAFTYRDHINYLGQESFAGCLSLSRPGSNLLAANQWQFDGDFTRLEIIATYKKPIVTWWTMLAPEWAVTWMATHLRNCISEEGYKFKKVPGKGILC